MAILCNTPNILMLEKSKYGKPFRNNPMAKIISERFTTFTYRSFFGAPDSILFENAKTIATPTINRKNGKMTSAKSIHATEHDRAAYIHSSSFPAY